MGIYIILVILLLCIVYLVIKLVNIKNSIKEMTKVLNKKVNIDTNNLITTSTTDKLVNNLANELNKNLKELRKQELKYKNRSQELQTSITNISHDLRTPLTAIRCFLDLIDKTNLTDKQRNYLKIIDSKAKDLTELTEQLFDFSKSLDNQKELKKEKIIINNILEETLVSFYAMFKEYNITPEINICKEKVIRWVNGNMLKRIFENIISNAIKYSEQDFNVRMYNNGTIEFSNKTGKLDKVSVEKIFDRYYTVKNAKKANGIGLSIAKQLVELIDGKIEAIYKNNYLIIKVIL